MKCPLCKHKLEVMVGLSKSVLGCPECKHVATIGIWEALICAKNQVDIAKRDLWTLQAQSGFCGFVAKKSLENIKKAGANGCI